MKLHMTHPKLPQKNLKIFYLYLYDSTKVDSIYGNY